MASCRRSIQTIRRAKTARIIPQLLKPVMSTRQPIGGRELVIVCVTLEIDPLFKDYKQMQGNVILELVARSMKYAEQAIS